MDEHGRADDGSRPGSWRGRGLPVPRTAEQRIHLDGGWIEPAELPGILADDELLDAFGPPRQKARRRAPGYPDDGQRLIALLWAWRADLDSEPWPEPIPIEHARRAAAHRATTSPVANTTTRVRSAQWRRRRLVPMATAATITALALSGVVLGAGAARPGDPLWPVAKTFDGDRARSAEAVYRVSKNLATARQALAQGRADAARAALATADVDLEQIHDPGIRHELARTSTHLRQTADTTPEGERVDTDEHGDPTQPHPSAASGPDPRSAPASPTEPSPRPDPRARQHGAPSRGSPTPPAMPRHEPARRSTRPSPNPSPSRAPAKTTTRPTARPTSGSTTKSTPARSQRSSTPRGTSTRTAANRPTPESERRPNRHH